MQGVPHGTCMLEKQAAEGQRRRAATPLPTAPPCRAALLARLSSGRPFGSGSSQPLRAPTRPRKAGAARLPASPATPAPPHAPAPAHRR
jgi:hypothetical protein